MNTPNIFEGSRIAGISLGIFFVISATIHTWEIFTMKNRSVKNLLRPLMTLALLAASAWPLINVFIR